MRVQCGERICHTKVLYIVVNIIPRLIAPNSMWNWCRYSAPIRRIYESSFSIELVSFNNNNSRRTLLMPYLIKHFSIACSFYCVETPKWNKWLRMTRVFFTNAGTDILELLNCLNLTDDKFFRCRKYAHFGDYCVAWNFDAV